jgi:uncharacterized protein YjiS (DUF1127 family)
MATLDLFRPSNRPGAVADLFGRVLAWRDRRRTFATLTALSDRELDDLGLVRSDLEAGILRRR